MSNRYRIVFSKLVKRWSVYLEDGPDAQRICDCKSKSWAELVCRLLNRNDRP